MSKPTRYATNYNRRLARRIVLADGTKLIKLRDAATPLPVDDLFPKIAGRRCEWGSGALCTQNARRLRSRRASFSSYRA